MARYQLKKKCLFVEAKVYDKTHWLPTDVKKPDDIKSAHLLDKSTKPATYLKLNDGAAFITRFIVMGVDTDLIPKILISEYGSAAANPQQEVTNVVKMLLPRFLTKRTYLRPHHDPQDLGEGTHSGKYSLNFRVNPFNVGILKGPL
jgi:hypothetical protein